MAIIKCKMCGGDIEFTPGATFGTCEYCGSASTLPNADDENKLNRYNRANHFRRQCEFDKALSAYEKLLEQDETDAEAHWGAVLSRYGIEYVEDPATKKRIPTCHRVQLTSILADADFKAAVDCAPDSESRRLYEEQAAQIAEIQKGILAVSANEKPYDVFICYKETDANGQRTRDSQWAQDVYYGLTEQGYKVFFSRITLEDKLGQQYEPYIFAALNSAKVMVVIGSKPEYFNAVWVKNEWSRYLALMANDRKRLLIPCYRDMDPYDLPDELSSLQSQDMGKIGFMQDLIRGIQKVLAREQNTTPATVSTTISTGTSTAPLLRRAFIFLEDGEWNKADEFCEQVLNLDPENGEAYLGKLMVQLKVCKREGLAELPNPFDSFGDYQKACRFDNNIACELRGYIAQIESRNENERVKKIYGAACQIMNEACDENTFKKAAALFESISFYLNAGNLAVQCYEKAELASTKKTRLQDEYNELQNKIHILSNQKDEKKVQMGLAKSGIQETPKQKRRSELKEQIKKLENELSALGLFSGKKKKILNDEISLLQRQIPTVDEIDTERKELQKSLPVVVALSKEIEVLDEQLQNYYKRLIEIREVLESEFGTMVSNMDDTESGDGYSAVFAEKVKVGGYFVFGSYEQDNNPNNGKEEIEWKVLAKEENRALLISRYALFGASYNDEMCDCTWNTCTLRDWMNNDFLKAAFSEEERASILTTTVKADVNPKYPTDPGSDTQDKLFLLSIQEATNYFASPNERKCKPTAYVKANVSEGDANGYVGWWLRSPGYKQNYAALVQSPGGICVEGLQVNLFGVPSPVRPAMWIRLES